MKRRNFLRTGSAVALPVLVNGFNLGFLPKSAFFDTIDENSDRVLVLIQLDGGNDGLSTLIPTDQYDNLVNHRAGVIIPEPNILPLHDHVGLHPRMTGFRDLFDEGKLTAIQAVSYPDQNRSHFRSTDIWQSGSAADEFVTSGWMGRYFDANFPGFPDDYPNDDYPDPFAITVQYTVSDTCQGNASNYSMALTDPFSVGQIDEATIDQLPDNNFGNEMAFLINAIAQTNAYSETILEAANAGANLSFLYDENSALAQQLKTVALLISGGLKTKVFIVRIGGFDTHANQVVAGSSTTGQHANLLGELSSAVHAFQDDLQKQGLEEKVLGMTFSEFGRQIKSNDSFGTDHGTAAPLFLFGSCVQGGVIGANPEIRQQIEPQEGVEMQFDYRSIYATILRDWFGTPDQEVQDLLFGDFEALPLIEGCVTSATDGPGVADKPYEMNVYPNPTSGDGTIDFYSTGGRVQITIFDQMGRQVGAIADHKYSKGRHNVPFSTYNLPNGSYIIRLQGDGTHEVSRLVKL
ncbi:MAG: hypothetical protein DRI69_04800 [Bacteroidetes bacterium]|nr:MAG: hypothetical protein DRI69_04800 [Bacteroidota bacterium]